MRDEQPAVSGIAGCGEMDSACGKAYSCFFLSFGRFRGHIWCRGLLYNPAMIERVMTTGWLTEHVIQIRDSHYGLQLKVKRCAGINKERISFT